LQYQTALDAGFVIRSKGECLQTKKAMKAQRLRRFADQSAERELKKYFITDYAPPEFIKYPKTLTPKSFQLESARHALTRTPAYIADEAGCGKTITSALCMNTVFGFTLVICPPFLKYNWAKEIEKWSTHGATIGVVEDGKTNVKGMNHLIIICPDSLLTNKAIHAALLTKRFTWLFVDEAHRYKTANAQRTKALLGDEKHVGISGQAERVVLLSGTPIPNGRPIELYPLLSKLAPESYGHLDYLSFGKQYCAGKQVVRYEGRRAIRNWDFSGRSHLKELRDKLRNKLMIRHLKKDVLKELGPKTRQIIFLDTPKKIETYERTNLRDVGIDRFIGEDQNLGDIAKYRRLVGKEKIIPSSLFIREHLESTNQKLVVFAHHVDVVETLTRLLKDFNPLMVRGGLSAKEKSARVSEFQTNKKCRVVIGNMDAMGVGNTLTKAPTVIVVEPSWVPGVNEQAEDRVHRMTQEQNVYIKYLVLRGSMDERVLMAVLDKQRAIDQVMD
jgi:SWI/SNF-related matrix-associated actin-dependent regulator 1 of chromatin subfamily A